MIASGYFFEIVDSIPSQVLVVKYVLENEILNYEQMPYKQLGVKIDNNYLSEHLEVIDIETDEEAEILIDYSLLPSLDAGEAYSAAVAVSRGYVLCTDDKAAIRLSKKESKFNIVSTLEIVKYWSEKKCLTVEEIHVVLLNIQKFGNYRPGKMHEYYQWWSKHIS